MTSWPISYTSYPLIGVGAIVNKQGRAWTVWALCKAIDDGSGRVARETLRKFMKHLGISGRQQRRWIAAAKNIELINEGMSKGVEYYWHASPDKAAVKVGAWGIGTPREMRIADLFSDDCWHKYVWAAYDATFDGRPVSQEKKYQLSGASPRLQRKWQQPDRDGFALSYPTFNYADTAIRSDQIDGMREVHGWHFIVNGDQVKQRLPNGRVVHKSISKPIGVGERTRKIRQKFEESLLLLGIISDGSEQANTSRGRQFCRSKNHAKRIMNKLKNVFLDERPQDIFERTSKRGRVNNYMTVSV